MPWPPKQRAAIAADMRRKGKSRAEISAFFRAHGHGDGEQTGLQETLRDKRKKTRRSEQGRKAANARHSKSRARPRRSQFGGGKRTGRSTGPY